MELTLVELKLLTDCIVTELIRIEEKNTIFSEDMKKVSDLERLGSRIDEEKMRIFRKEK